MKISVLYFLASLSFVASSAKVFKAEEQAEGGISYTEISLPIALQNASTEELLKYDEISKRGEDVTCGLCPCVTDAILCNLMAIDILEGVPGEFPGECKQIVCATAQLLANALWKAACDTACDAIGKT